MKMQVHDLDRDSGRWSPQMASTPHSTKAIMFRDANEVDEIIRTLQLSAEHDELKSALQKLEQLFFKSPRCIEENQAHISVLSTMTHLTTDLEIQLLGLQILHNFMLGSKIMEDKLRRKLGLFNHILKLLNENLTNEQIHSRSIRLLDNLLKSDHLRRQISQNKHWGKLMDVVFHGVNYLSDDAVRLVESFQVITIILKEEPDLRDTLAKKYLYHLLHLVKTHSGNVEFIKALFKLLRTAASNKEIRPILGLPILNIVKSLMSKWPSESSVIVESFSLLETLSHDDKVSELLIEKDFVTVMLLPELISRADDPNIQLTGLRIFLSTADQMFIDTSLSGLASQWLKVIYLAMSRHMGKILIQAWGCKALCKLLECRPEVYMWIGENSELKQDPIHTLCLGAILMYGEDEEVFISACKSIYYLTADNDGLCKTLMDKNAHIEIIEGVRKHLAHPKAVSAACRAIRGLCIFQNDHKKKMAEYERDLLSLLVEIIKTYQSDAEVQSEVISTIVCLADIDMIRHQCFVVNIHVRILEAMDNFPGDEYLQEAAIEALAVLGGAAKGSEILNSHRCIDKIIKCLKRFLYNGNIQKKGLWAIQILAEWQLVQSTVMCKELALIIKSTMKNHPNSLIIQKEAIVAMQILSERGVEEEKRVQYSNMAEVLVDLECHELLFQILEKHDDDQGLHDLASECLYVIGIEQDLKSRMLLTACSKGFIAGAECLIEVGADVNIGQGSDTPLYYAVSSNNERMVELLLRHEVRDVQTSLRLSLEKGYHKITGLLLAHIGRDKEMGTVLWSNFNLRDLRPEWIIPTLQGKEPKAHSSSIASKHFVAKIKNSEMRRNNRRILQYSPSDSNLEIKRHMCFRYRKSSGDLQNTTFEAIHELHVHNQTESKVQRPSMNLNSPRLRTAHMKSIEIFSPLLTENKNSSSVEVVRTEVDLNDIPAFEHSEDDREDWKMTTLTGADIPFSPADPRRPSDPSKIIEHVPTKFISSTAMQAKWQRKFHSRESQRRRQTTKVCQSVLLEGCQSSAEASFGEEVSLSSANTSDILSSDTEFSQSPRASSVMSVHSADETDGDIGIDELKATKISGYNIRSLDISSNHIVSLDLLSAWGNDLMQSFSSIERLDLSNNDLTLLPGELFKSLTGLRYLNLSNNQITLFPDCVCLCPSLHLLDLSSNKIEKISLTSQKCSSLTELCIMKNSLKEFPFGLEQAFPHLTKLDISSNQMRELPHQPCNLQELRCLDISHNAIMVLPDEFLRPCSKLELLVAVNNGLETLPNESSAANLTRLSTVKLSINRITEKEPFYIPKFILELPNLRIIDLCSNGIMGFPPPTLWKSQMLKDLLLSKNHITKLNMEGSRMWSKLEKLHLSYNKISEASLPREIGQLTSLQSLDLSYNKPLTTLPDELGSCSRLWEMPLEGLSLDLDDALTRGRVKDLTIYLHNRLKKAQRYFRMKLMVVGYGGRGKTSLLQGLKRKIKNNSSEKPSVTVGVIVDDWKYERQRFGKTVTYTLNTWDFAGQEDFYSTHQCFLSNRTLYLVVYDISMGPDEIDKLKPWLSNIHARAPDCPVIVVGTHYDLIPAEERETTVAEFEVKLKELLNKPGLPMISCFAIVDVSKESLELQQLRNKVKEIVDGFKIKGQHVMGQKVPASYVRLGELLHEEAKRIEKSFPVIRHSQLLRLIKSGSLILDDEERKQAITFLHESGVLLHYNETALQMRDFYFINPGWLCRMMAQVVTVPEINPFIDRNGIMKRSAASLLFTGKETSGDSNFVFPSNLIPQYLHLLEKFEIALPRNEEELLIPCRLPYRRPYIELPVQDRTELVFRYYVMPHTPIGFWSRLLTRLTVFSESKFAENMLSFQGKPSVQFWKEGIFVKWSSSAFFLVDSFKGSSDEIHMTVPNTTHGCRLLGYLVDHADSLVDEWYPGLISVDPRSGRELLEKFAPCTVCEGTQPYSFRFEDLLKRSEFETEIYCPEHHGSMDLVKLAPDIMLADIEPQFHLDLDQFQFKESVEDLCGDGGFGSVFKAKYRGKVVAVKVFSSIGDIHPHKMLRQEATIMRRLNHPSVVALVAVGIRPVRLVVMEFAPHKSLGDVFRSGFHLSRTLQLKIAQQVSEGLAYLHSLMIIYRDMKPDNVLIFSFAPGALINAKIADYGISQFTTLFGLMAQEGTPGFRAPEVIRGEIYSYQADIFSLGVLLYMVLTGGLHPFDELEFKSEIDKAFAENFPIPLITQRGCPPWPDFQELITQCLNQVPDYRPKASYVFELLSSAELFSLREVLPVSVGTTVECIATQAQSSQNVRLWVASGDNEYMQLTWFNLFDYRDENLSSERSRQSVDYRGVGTMFRDGRVLCIMPVNQEYILLGTQAGKIWVFSTISSELVHSTQQLDDSVLSLYIVHRRGDDPLVLAGLANGKMALYPMSEILQSPDMDPIEMKLGECYEPVRCILRSSTDRKLIASCGTKVVVMETRIGVAVENIFNTVEGSNSSSNPITSMACGRQLFLAHRNSNVVEAWDVIRGRHKNSLDISKTFKLSLKDSRITAMVLHDVKILWVGTGGGQIALIDVNNWTPIICTHRHTASIRCLTAVKLKGLAKYGPNASTGVILSGGLGFRNRSEYDTEKENQYGCIGVWDADFPQTFKQFSDWSKKRKELNESSTRK
ncbi:unnamed protein product [Lymnaea stagnalis]|uniref:non-specific serine/threonine protein kinase n=1 Tax=Lymnaea stagnalis TaxID=6523 RepID=A0AAV2HKZ8_LYMST